MSWLKDLWGVLRSLVITEPIPQPDLKPMHRHVLLVAYNPVVPGEGGRKLNRVLGWNDPEELARLYAADLRAVSGGLADFEIVDRVEVNGWPVKVDGFTYTVDAFLNCRRNQGGWHDPDWADYSQIASDLRLVPRVLAGEIDEVWLFGTPAAGFYESRMAGPGAFWCNSPELQNSSGSGRRFIIMGFNYERGVGEMLESFSHRVESHLERAWRRYARDPERNLWHQFILYDKVAPGRAQCGNVHFAPNSERDYDWGNPRFVLSSCDNWLRFPDLSGAPRQVNCADWGNGDTRAHHLWWLLHLPRVAGSTHGVSNNWWQLAVDPNAVL
jgi:hypothetical protein